MIDNSRKTKLKDVCKIEKGKIGITKAIEGEYPLVVTAEDRKSHNEWHFDEPATIVPLVSSTGHGHASIKRLHYAEGKYAVGNILATLIPKDHKYLNAKYLYVYLTINKEELLVSQMTGAANVSLTLTKLKEVEVEIPDYDIQLRVIKKYEQSEKFKNQVTNQIEYRSENISLLRQQILQDAITGNLSEKWRKENPNVESAEVLLEKIKAEKEKLVEGGEIKKQKPLPPITENERPFELPEGWVWCRLGEAINTTLNGISKRSGGKGQSTIVLRLADIIDYKITLENPRELILDESEIEKYKLEEDDILVTRVNGSIDIVGNFNIVKLESNDWITYCDHFIRLRLQRDAINTHYIFYLEKASYFRDTVKRIFKTTAGQKTINQTHLTNFLIPLPPLSEQKHIVNRIESLFSKINRIRRLNTNNQDTTELLNKILLKETFEE